jgi:hypothetical protein
VHGRIHLKRMLKIDMGEFYPAIPGLFAAAFITGRLGVLAATVLI